MIRHVIALTILSVAAFAAEAPLLSFVHPEAKILAGIQVERALASPLGRYLLAQIDEDNKGFRTFMEDTGVDPRRDVREILLVASDTQRKHGLAVARGGERRGRTRHDRQKSTVRFQRTNRGV